ncbi:MAG TPA: PQQ-dependent sugar dehydrogenase [Actinomycetota bacterium]|nr:PQQ-dependent sugar dehydrogenase [Actinomycetota bacterium]
MRILRTLAAAALVCLATGAGASAGPAHHARAGTTDPFKAVPVVIGLDQPVTFTFTPGGRIFFGEKATGQINVVNPQNGNIHRFTTITHVVSDGEQGLLGLALDPQYPSRPFVFAYATRNVAGGEKDQILRMKNVGGHAENIHVIFSSETVSGHYHDGGHISFGPDGFLYAVQGEAHHSANAQDLGISAGKILRMTETGAPAPGNPGFADGRIFSFGHRNSFGFAFDPQTNWLWETENGPECTDEINLVVKGGNYAWGPSENCSDPKPGGTNQDGPAPRHLPKAFFADTIAPTGIVFCDACGLGAGTNGKFLFGNCNSPGEIHRVGLTADRQDIASQTIVLHDGSCVYSMEHGPHGGIYFSDSSGGIFKLAHR